MQTQAIIRNQREPFLYTVRVESDEGWCEARNLSHEVALAYVAAQQDSPPEEVAPSHNAGEKDNG